MQQILTSKQIYVKWYGMVKYTLVHLFAAKEWFAMKLCIDRINPTDLSITEFLTNTII